MLQDENRATASLLAFSIFHFITSNGSLSILYYYQGCIEQLNVPWYWVINYIAESIKHSTGYFET